MKQLTQKDVDVMQALIAGNRNRIEAILHQLSKIQDKLHECKTVTEIDAVESEYRELIEEGNDLMKNIGKMKKQIAEFYAPAQR